MDTAKRTEVKGHALSFRDWQTRSTKTRLYVTFASEEEVEAASGIKYSDLRATRRGEEPEMDALYDRWNRWVVKLTRPHVMAALQELGFEGVKVTFGKKAGCSCGCSPCFVADRMLTWEGRGLEFISVRREGEK